MKNKGMKQSKKKQKVCINGHTFYKSSDCPVCPICEKEKKPKDEFLSLLGAPARRALESEGIKTLKQLSRYSEAELLKLHGMGPSTIPKLAKALERAGLAFRK